MAPTNLETNTTTSTSVELTWMNATAGSFDSYRLYVNGSQYADIPDVSGRYNATGLMENTNNAFTLRAVAGDQESVDSNSVSAWTSKFQLSFR